MRELLHGLVKRRRADLPLPDVDRPRLVVPTGHPCTRSRLLLRPLLHRPTNAHSCACRHASAVCPVPSESFHRDGCRTGTGAGPGCLYPVHQTHRRVSESGPVGRWLVPSAAHSQLLLARLLLLLSGLVLLLSLLPPPLLQGGRQDPLLWSADPRLRAVHLVRPRYLRSMPT